MEYLVEHCELHPWEHDTRSSFTSSKQYSGHLFLSPCSTFESHAFDFTSKVFSLFYPSSLHQIFCCQLGVFTLFNYFAYLLKGFLSCLGSLSWTLYLTARIVKGNNHFDALPVKLSIHVINNTIYFIFWKNLDLPFFTTFIFICQNSLLGSF